MSNLKKFLGMLVEHVPELTSAERQKWIENPSALASALAKALRSEAAGEYKTLTVPADIPLTRRIAVGRYSWVNENITKVNFPHDPMSVGECEWKMVHFEQETSSEDALAAIKVSDWVPATIEHLLVFGKKYPEEQKKYPIVALGSWCTVDGDRYVPVLNSDDRGDGMDRSLALNEWDGDWYEHHRFLVVRKKV